MHQCIINHLESPKIISVVLEYQTRKHGQRSPKAELYDRRTTKEDCKVVNLISNHQPTYLSPIGHAFR